jgi:phage shock protein B
MGSEIIVIPAIVIGLPWIILHYVTKWKSSATLTREDENLLEDMSDTARCLDDRLATIERIMAADNPNWKSGL